MWREAFRVLRPGGVLLAGFNNPAVYIFDLIKADETGVLEVKYALPYSDLTHRTDEELQRQMDEGWPLEFSHSLDDQIGGQLAAGFLIAGFFEDRYPAEQNDAVSRILPPFIATPRNQAAGLEKGRMCLTAESLACSWARSWA